MNSQEFLHENDTKTSTYEERLAVLTARSRAKQERFKQFSSSNRIRAMSLHRQDRIRKINVYLSQRQLRTVAVKPELALKPEMRMSI